MGMKSKPAEVPRRLYLGADVPLRVIRAYAQAIVKRFQPDRIILFGSHAFGTPHADSDVDLLVVMPCRNELDQAARISWELPAPFATDLLVRKPSELDWRLEEGEAFTLEVVTKGKVLYEKGHPRVGEKGRGRLSVRRNRGPEK